MKQKTFITIALCTLLVGCGSAHQVAHLHQVERDSTYHQNIQYDSIYIYQSHEKDYRIGHPELVSGSAKDLEGPPDTVIIKDVSIEYRYKLLRDTIRIVQRDSIPYPVTVIETKEVRYIPWWSKALSILGGLCLAGIVGKLALKRLNV